MHRCLEVLEILRDVFCYLQKNADLLSVALTCRVFKQVALPLLWEDLWDFYPVIEIFPSDARKTIIQWEYSHGFVGGKAEVYTYTLARKLNPQDWDRVLQYLPLIRAIDTLHLFKVSDDFLKSMVATFPAGGRIFPNLRSFGFHHIPFTDDVLTFIESILDPQLECLSMGLTKDSSEQKLHSFLRSIPILCLFLKKLEFAESIDHFPAISEVICQFQHLEELLVPDLSPEAFIHLSQLPRLRTLQFDSQINLHPPPIPRPAFPAIESLTICGGTPAFHTAIHATITSNHYQHYEANFDVPATAEEWKGLLINVQSAGVREIFFPCEHKPQDSQSRDYVLTPDMLKSLLSPGGNLTELLLTSVFTFDLDDDFILELAKACTKLQLIDLGTRWNSGRRPRTTLMSYAHLIRHCPEICSIGLVVDASGAERNSQVSPAEGSKNRIRYRKIEGYKPYFGFIVGNSWIRDPIAVAAFLSSFVDSEAQDCVRIFAASDARPEIIKAWELVEKLIPTFAAVRAQERRNLAFGASGPSCRDELAC